MLISIKWNKIPKQNKWNGAKVISVTELSAQSARKYLIVDCENNIYSSFFKLFGYSYLW